MAVERKKDAPVVYNPTSLTPLKAEKQPELLTASPLPASPVVAKANVDKYGYSTTVGGAFVQGMKELFPYAKAALVNGVTTTLNHAKEDAFYEVKPYQADVPGVPFLARGSRMLQENASYPFQTESEGMNDLSRRGFTDIINLCIENDWDSQAAKSATPHALKSTWLPIEDMGTPTHEHIARFLNVLKDVERKGGKAYVHCEAGIGRTGVMVAIAEMYFGHKTADQVIEEFAKNKANGGPDYTMKLQNQIDAIHNFENFYKAGAYKIDGL